MKLTAFSAAAILAFTSFAAAAPAPDDGSALTPVAIPVRWNDVEAGVLAAQASADSDNSDTAVPTDSTDSSVNDDSVITDYTATADRSSNTLTARSNNKGKHGYQSFAHRPPTATDGHKSGAEGGSHGGSNLFGRAPNKPPGDFNGGGAGHHKPASGGQGGPGGPGGHHAGFGGGNPGQMPGGGKTRKRSPMPKKNHHKEDSGKESVENENPFDHGEDHKDDPSWG